MDPSGIYFGSAAPPPPFGIAILQICFQVTCIAAVFFFVNTVAEGVKNHGIFFFIPGTVKEEVELRELNPEMEVVSQSFIFENRNKTTIVAMTSLAVVLIKESCKRFQGDRLAFCRMDIDETAKSANLEDYGRSKDGIVYDALALSDGGKSWTWLNFAEAEKMKTLKPIHSEDSIVDSWFLKLVLGKPEWISANDEEVPIKYPTL